MITREEADFVHRQHRVMPRPRYPASLFYKDAQKHFTYFATTKMHTEKLKAIMVGEDVKRKLNLPETITWMGEQVPVFAYSDDIVVCAYFTYR